jgi:uncharacterized membrane protein YesL
MGLYLRSTFIVSYSPYPLDLRQSKKSSFILCSIKTHKASIALQVLFLIGSLVVTIFQPFLIVFQIVGKHEAALHLRLSSPEMRP